MAKYGEYIPLEVPRISLNQNFIPNIRQVKNQASAIQNIRKDRSERREELLATRPDLAQAISDVAFSSLQPRQRAQGAGLHELWREAAESGIVLGLLALEDDRFVPGLIEPVMATILQMDSLSKATTFTDKIPGNEGLMVSLVISWCVNAGHYVVVTDTPVEELVSQFHQDVAHVLKQLFGPEVGVAHLDT